MVVFPAIIDDSITRREFFASWRAELKEMPKDQCEDDMSLIRLLQVGGRSPFRKHGDCSGPLSEVLAREGMCHRWR